MKNPPTKPHHAFFGKQPTPLSTLKIIIHCGFHGCSAMHIKVDQHYSHLCFFFFFGNYIAVLRFWQSRILGQRQPISMKTKPSDSYAKCREWYIKGSILLMPTLNIAPKNTLNIAP